MINVMICDDLEIILSHFQDIINSQNDMEVICTASSTAGAIETAKKYKPDVILMDIQMDESNSGIIASKEITQLLPNIKIIMLTIHSDDEKIIDAYMAGAVDYILKDSDPGKICSSIRKAYTSNEFLGSYISTTLKKKVLKSREQEISLLYLINYLSKLTPTEVKILKLLYHEKKRRKIATDEHMSEETVKLHIRHILRKLNFKTSSEMIAYLKKIGVMEFFLSDNEDGDQN